MPPTPQPPVKRDETPGREPVGDADVAPVRDAVVVPAGDADVAPVREVAPVPVRDALRDAAVAPVRERGDACPGALRLHSADDGRLARLRLPGGLLTYRQAEALAVAAERLGDGHLDITSRGNIQLRGLGAACGGELEALLDAAGLLPSPEHERVRNIVASPLCGLDGPASAPRPGPAPVREVPSGNAQLWARELDALLCASPAATALSGRFLFALDDGRGDVAALGADVTLLARADGGATVHIGANHPGVRVSAADAPRAALLAAETFVAEANGTGTGAWRVRELPDGGRELAGALAARLTKAGIEARQYEPTAPTASQEPWPYAAPPPPGRIASPDGTVALSVHAPLGRLSAEQWRLLLSESGTGELRVTPWRGVIIPGLPPAAADALRDRLRTAGLITTPDSPWHGVGACTGRPGCAKALADVRSDAADALAADVTVAGAASRDALPVYWSGCARRCGHPGGAWVDVVATEAGDYTVSVHGHGVPQPTAPATTTRPRLPTTVATARTRSTTVTK
ncbi:precorrin-3B synthase [Streptomyces paludis]|nr:precorrin-3B synthase [Streptomyces paludis]